MFRLGSLFLVIALVSAFFGFVGVAGLSFDVGQLFFFIFMVLAAVAFAIEVHGRGSPRDPALPNDK